VYTGPGMPGSAIAMTSNSCPANLAIKRELSGTFSRIVQNKVMLHTQTPHTIPAMASKSKV